MIGCVIKPEDKPRSLGVFALSSLGDRISLRNRKDSGRGVSQASQEQKKAIGGRGRQLLPAVCCVGTHAAELKPDTSDGIAHTKFPASIQPLQY